MASPEPGAVEAAPEPRGAAAPGLRVDAAALVPLNATVREVDGRIVLREREGKGPHLAQFAVPAIGVTGFAVSVRAMERPGVALLLRDRDGRLQAAARARLDDPSKLEVTPGADATLRRDGPGWVRLSLSTSQPIGPGARFGIMALAEDAADIAYAGLRTAGLRLRDIEVLPANETAGQPDALPLSWTKVVGEERVLGPAYADFLVTAIEAATEEARFARLGIRLVRVAQEPGIELRPADSEPLLFATLPPDMPTDEFGPVLHVTCRSYGAAELAAFAASLAAADARLLAALIAALPRLTEEALAVTEAKEAEVWRFAARSAAAFADALPG